ncbi:unnamed protein product [Rhizophagus irregularis]|nr:unnamed protein product [Rhizophagus irregularis]
MASTTGVSTPSFQMNNESKDFDQVINETSSSSLNLKTQPGPTSPNLYLHTPPKLNGLKSPSRSLSPSRLSRPPSPVNPNVPVIYSRPSSPSRDHLKDPTMKYVDELLFVFYDALDNYPINQIIILIRRHLEDNDQKEEKIFKWLLNNEHDERQ